MKMEGKRVSLNHVIALIILLALSCFLLTTIIGDILGERVSKNVDEATGFIHEYMQAILEKEDQGMVFSKYFPEYMDNADNEAYLRYTFERVFLSYDYGNSDYNITVVCPGFIIIKLYTDFGKLLPPPIGFWYTLDKDGKFTSWRLGRLLPFSGLDVEYSSVWDEVYE